MVPSLFNTSQQKNGKILEATPYNRKFRYMHTFQLKGTDAEIITDQIPTCTIFIYWFAGTILANWRYLTRIKCTMHSYYFLNY